MTSSFAPTRLHGYPDIQHYQEAPIGTAMNTGPAPLLSVIVPTRNESGNIPALVARLCRPLRLMFRMRRMPAADVDDLVQETLLVVLRRLRRELPDDPNGVQAFAEATARNLSIGEVRKRMRREELLKMAGETLSPAPELPPERAWSASETARLVRQSVEQLGQPRDQLVLREHYLNGVDKASLCDRHGMSSAHFDRILFNARKRLRQLLRLRGVGEAP